MADTIETWQQPLPHGITLSCRGSGARGRPVLVFLHGFPEAAFVWDAVLAHFADPAHGGYRCVAPNLRGYEASSTPAEVEAYRAKHLVQDIAALIASECGPGGRVAALVAHDWGGAVAWGLANQRPDLLERLVIVNSPHPGTFLRELQSNPLQQAASAYMNFLVRPDAPALLAKDDFARMWSFFTAMGPDGAPWLTDAVRADYRAVWQRGLAGGCNYYRASPLRPPVAGEASRLPFELPREMLTVDVPTLVLWALGDKALLPGLLDGLGEYVRRLRLRTVEDATHWIVHEQPGRVIAEIAEFLDTPPHSHPTPA